jgi:uncharacterized protein (UPF0332 family)
MLARDLLEQARELVASDPRRPKQVNLRRAISSAYYALFHLLSGDAAERMVHTHGGLRQIFARTFEHGEMKAICAQFAKDQLPRRLRSVVPSVSPVLRHIATTFVDLQAARHEADYNLAKRFSRNEAIVLILRAGVAYDEWVALPWNKEADAFVVALAMGRKLKGD